MLTTARSTRFSWKCETQPPVFFRTLAWPTLLTARTLHAPSPPDALLRKNTTERKRRRSRALGSANDGRLMISRDYRYFRGRREVLMNHHPCWALDRSRRRIRR